MKFLIAATFLCLSLVGQIQGGSLRGINIPVPHRAYGLPVLDNAIPIEETKPIVEDSDSSVVELEKNEEPMAVKPSIEYGVPAVATDIKTDAFVDSLPLVDSIVSFGTPSDYYGAPARPIDIVPTIPKVELPYLEPGLPSLPAAPVLPVVIEKPAEVEKVSNTYLPPVENSFDFLQGKPIEVYGPPPTPEAPKINEVILPLIHEIPALPEAPTNIPEISDVSADLTGQYLYEAPAVDFHTPTNRTPEKVKPSEVYGLPQEQKPRQEYGPPAVTVVIPEIPKAPITPVVTEYVQPSKVYGPPRTPEAPKPIETIQVTAISEPIPKVPVSIQPTLTKVNTVPVEAIRQYYYEAPEVAFPTPVSAIDSVLTEVKDEESTGKFHYEAPVSVQSVVQEVKVTPEKSTGHYHYEAPKTVFPTPISIGHGIVSQSGLVKNSGSLQLNKYEIPISIQPYSDAILIEEVKPLGPGFAIHSLTGNSKITPTRTYNHVSLVNQVVPSFGIVAKPTPLVLAPQRAYGAANF